MRQVARSVVCQQGSWVTARQRTPACGAHTRMRRARTAACGAIHSATTQRKEPPSRAPSVLAVSVIYAALPPQTEIPGPKHPPTHSPLSSMPCHANSQQLRPLPDTCQATTLPGVGQRPAALTWCAMYTRRLYVAMGRRKAPISTPRRLRLSHTNSCSMSSRRDSHFSTCVLVCACSSCAPRRCCACDAWRAEAAPASRPLRSAPAAALNIAAAAAPGFGLARPSRSGEGGHARASAAALGAVLGAVLGAAPARLLRHSSRRGALLRFCVPS